MNVEKISKLHAELLSGISIEDLEDRTLLKLGGILLKQYRGAKNVIRKLDTDQVSQLSHWEVVRVYCYNEIDTVLTELEKRMYGVDEFDGGMLVSFVDLVGSIRFSIFDEERLDNNVEEPTDDIELILED